MNALLAKWNYIQSKTSTLALKYKYIHNKMCEPFGLRYEQFIVSIKIKAVKYEISPSEAKQNETTQKQRKHKKKNKNCRTNEMKEKKN